MNTTKQLPSNLMIEEMLKRKTFEQLLLDGDLFTPDEAAPLMGYTAMHVRYLCRENKVEHVKRGDQYFLYARTVFGHAQHVAPNAKKSR